MYHQTKSSIQLCGACGSQKIQGACPRCGQSTSKKEAKVPKWMLKSARRMEQLSN